MDKLGDLERLEHLSLLGHSFTAVKKCWPTTQAPARDEGDGLAQRVPSGLAPRRQRRRLLWRATQWKHRRRLARRIRSEKFTRSGNTYTATGGVQQDLGYQYDLGGNIIGIRDKAPANYSAEGPGDLLKQFSYDPLKRLLTATGRESTAPSALPLWDAGVRAHDYTATNTYTRAYTYDKMGNVLQ